MRLLAMAIGTRYTLVELFHCKRANGANEAWNLDFAMLTDSWALHCLPLSGGRGVFIPCQCTQR